MIYHLTYHLISSFTHLISQLTIPSSSTISSSKIGTKKIQQILSEDETLNRFLKDHRAVQSIKSELVDDGRCVMIILPSYHFHLISVSQLICHLSHDLPSQIIICLTIYHLIIICLTIYHLISPSTISSHDLSHDLPSHQ